VAHDCISIRAHVRDTVIENTAELKTSSGMECWLESCNASVGEDVTGRNKPLHCTACSDGSNGGM